MSSIYVPPRTAAAIERQNLCQSILLLVGQGEEKGVPAQALREFAAWKAAREGSSPSVMAAEVARAERWLIEKKLIRTDGVTLWVAPVSDLRAFLAREAAGDSAPLIVLPGAAA
jgi:hypothetical protein